MMYSCIGSSAPCFQQGKRTHSYWLCSVSTLGFFISSLVLRELPSKYNTALFQKGTLYSGEIIMMRVNILVNHVIIVE